VVFCDILKYFQHIMFDTSNLHLFVFSPLLIKENVTYSLPKQYRIGVDLRYVQTLESPEIKMLRFPSLKSPGKKHKSWKNVGILKSWF